MPTLHNITPAVLTPMSVSYSLAVAALRCSSWNKPRTQSFWGWRRSHSSFLSLLRRLHCLSSCSAATRPINTSEELRDVNRWLIPSGTVGTRPALPVLGSALLFRKERWKKKKKSVFFCFHWILLPNDKLVFEADLSWEDFVLHANQLNTWMSHLLTSLWSVNKWCWHIVISITMCHCFYLGRSLCCQGPKETGSNLKGNSISAI